MVTAVVRPDKLGAIKQALAEINAPSLTVTNVSGRGSQAKTGQWRGEEFTVDLHQKVKIEVVVADIPADEVAEAISEAAKTGEPGDGKVFILPVEDACRSGRARPARGRYKAGPTTERQRIGGESTAKIRRTRTADFNRRFSMTLRPQRRWRRVRRRRAASAIRPPLVARFGNNFHAADPTLGHEPRALPRAVRPRAVGHARRRQFSVRATMPHPFFIERGDGGHVIDADGNRYVDWVMGYGPLLYGHDLPDPVQAAIQSHVAAGPMYGAPTEIEGRTRRVRGAARPERGVDPGSSTRGRRRPSRRCDSRAAIPAATRSS